MTSSIISNANCWLELNRENLSRNITFFKSLIGETRKMAAVVKANAYGHGMVEVAKTALASGADWLHVFSVSEAVRLRQAGIEAPVLVLGPAFESELGQAVEAEVRLTVSDRNSSSIVSHAPGCVRVHLKLETGTNRQGLREAEVGSVVEQLTAAGMIVEGAYTHYANIEDTTDHSFATGQLNRFVKAVSPLSLSLCHTACSAAAILFPNTYFQMVRVGISMYGLWPSTETQVSAKSLGRNDLQLAPVLSWKTRISQVKTVPAGEYIGYGCSFRCTRDSNIAILPVGYADGYPRALSNVGYVLVRGIRAPIRGRICMNLMMIDVSDVSDAAFGDEVVLIGEQGGEVVSADTLAKLAGTINYEIVTRAAPNAPRIWI